MSDEELLKTAEDLLHFGQTKLPADNYIQMSIAVSLLVIARNTLPITVSQQDPSDFKERNRQ